MCHRNWSFENLFECFHFFCVAVITQKCLKDLPLSSLENGNFLLLIFLEKILKFSFNSHFGEGKTRKGKESFP